MRAFVPIPKGTNKTKRAAIAAGALLPVKRLGKIRLYVSFLTSPSIPNGSALLESVEMFFAGHRFTRRKCSAFI
ncbi:MAG: hypothetical protein ACRBM6_08890 [Geminicoccales bacterium]